LQQRQEHQHIVPRAVAAESDLVLLAHDGERVENVAGVVGTQAVEMEEQRVQRRQPGAAIFVVPLDGRQHLAGSVHVIQVTREGRQIMRGVAQGQHLGDHKVGHCGLWVMAIHEAGFAHAGGEGGLKRVVETSSSDDATLFDDEPVQVLPLDLLAQDEIVRIAIEVGQEQGNPAAAAS